LDEAHCKWYILNNYKHSSDISFKGNEKLIGKCEICRERRWLEMLRIEARILRITFPLFLKRSLPSALLLHSFYLNLKLPFCLIYKGCKT
jgi:hypothetical protein